MNNFCKIFLIIISCITSTTAYSLQIKDVSEGAEIRANISANDLNRIQLKGDKIISAKANVGDINLSYEKSTGDIFVRPKSNNQSKILNLFLVSEKGYTYKLLLTPRFIPSEQIFLRNDAIINEDIKAFRKDDYKSAIINLYKAMQSSGSIEGYSITHTDRRSFLNKKLRTRLKSVYNSRIYRGELFRVTNKQKDSVLLKESDFFTAGVLAVKIDKVYLERGEATNIYIIRG